MYLDEYIRCTLPENNRFFPVDLKEEKSKLDDLTDDPDLQSLWGLFAGAGGQADLRRIARREKGDPHWIFEK